MEGGTRGQAPPLPGTCLARQVLGHTAGARGERGCTEEYSLYVDDVAL